LFEEPGCEGDAGDDGLDPGEALSGLGASDEVPGATGRDGEFVDGGVEITGAPNSTLGALGFHEDPPIVVGSENPPTIGDGRAGLELVGADVAGTPGEDPGCVTEIGGRTGAVGT